MKVHAKAKRLRVLVTDVSAIKVLLDATSAMLVHSLGVQYSKNVDMTELRSILAPAYEKITLALGEFGIKADVKDLFGLRVECLVSLGYMIVYVNHETESNVQPYNIHVMPGDGKNWGLRLLSTNADTDLRV
jgi:hypothetical protein